MSGRFLIDVVHPAHFHFYRNLVLELMTRGDEVLLATRDKDVTLDLVESVEINAVKVSSVGGGGRLSQARELVARDVALSRLVRTFRPDVVLTRNPAGVHASLARRSTTGIFDTDDGVAAGLHYYLARPARIVTMPVGVEAGKHPRVRRYESFKALAYLHPKRFTPRDVRSEIGSADEPLYVIRTVAMSAAHDHGESGIPLELLREIVKQLLPSGRVIISSESELGVEFSHLRNPLPPSDFHSLVASADLVIGDSQTVATEAAILGTPVVHVSSWSRRLDVLLELEDRWKLVESFSPSSSQIIEAISRLSEGTSKDVWGQRRSRMLESKVDLTDWYLSLLNAI